MIRRRWAAFCDGFWEGFTGIYIHVFGKDADPNTKYAPHDSAERRAEEAQLWGDLHPDIRDMAIREQEDVRTDWLATQINKRKGEHDG